MNKKYRGILLGMVFGDGYIAVDSRNPKYCGIRITHSDAQKEYLKYKAQLLGEILNKKAPKVHPFNNNGYPAWRISKNDSYFRVLRKWLYRKDRKIFPLYILNWITPHGLALWWQDDGSLYMKRRRGKIHAREGILSTYVSLEENQVIAQWLLNAWNIKAIPVASKGSYRLRFNTENLKKLIPIIAPYVIPTMQYKISMQYDNDNSALHPTNVEDEDIVRSTEEILS